MNDRISRLAPLLAVVMLAATAAAGCCEEESTAPDPVTPSAPAAATPTPKADPAPVAAAKDGPPGQAPASEPAVADPEADGPPDEMPVDGEPPPGVVPGSGDPRLEGKTPEEIAEIMAADEKRRGGFAAALSVKTGEDGWELDYGTVSDDSHLVIAMEEKKGDLPSFKAALVKGGTAEGTTSDLAEFSGADEALLAKFKNCDQWGQNSREVLDLGDAGKALRVSFWCNRQDGTSRELVIIKSAPEGAATLADLKNLWVGEGGFAERANDKCQLVTDAQFTIEGKQLVRTRVTTAAFMAPPLPDDPEKGGEPVVVDAAAEEPADPTCKAPEEPAVDKFALAI